MSCIQRETCVHAVHRNLCSNEMHTGLYLVRATSLKQRLEEAADSTANKLLDQIETMARDSSDHICETYTQMAAGVSMVGPKTQHLSTSCLDSTVAHCACCLLSLNVPGCTVELWMTHNRHAFLHNHTIVHCSVSALLSRYAHMVCMCSIAPVHLAWKITAACCRSGVTF